MNIVPLFAQRWRRITLSVLQLTVERNHVSLYQIVTVGAGGKRDLRCSYIGMLWPAPNQIRFRNCEFPKPKVGRPGRGLGL